MSWEISGVLGITLVLTIWLACYAMIVVPKQQRIAIESSLAIFSTSVDLRVQGYAGLSERVVDLSGQVAEALLLRTEQIERLTDAARLRDIGLCAIPWQLLNEKTPADWTNSEQEIVARHSEISAAMVELIPSLQHLADIVRHHHSPYEDYPGTLIESRILNAVDEYVGRERFQGSLLAREYLSDEAGRKFDPVVVATLFEVLTNTRESTEKSSVSIA